MEVYAVGLRFSTEKIVSEEERSKESRRSFPDVNNLSHSSWTPEPNYCVCVSCQFVKLLPLF